MNKLLVLFSVLILTSCSGLLKGKGKKGKEKKDVEMPYEIPPNAPIPPEKYCYELGSDIGPDKIRVELNVEGDSVSGNLQLAPANRAATHGTLNGQIFGNTIFLNYKYRGVDGTDRADAQEWKFGGDSLVKRMVEFSNNDTLGDQKYLDKILYLNVLHKVPCK